MSDTRFYLAEWFEGAVGEKLPDSGSADLLDQFGIDGDDAGELMESFARRFGVDGDNYRWYFHHSEEGSNFGGVFFAPPDRRVKRLPITPDILIEAIEAKKWPLEYPSHKVPTARWDIRLNQLLLVIPVVLAALWLWQRFAP